VGPFLRERGVPSPLTNKIYHTHYIDPTEGTTWIEMGFFCS